MVVNQPFCIQSTFLKKIDNQTHSETTKFNH